MSGSYGALNSKYLTLQAQLNALGGSIGGSTTLEEAITNGSGVATSSFQIQATPLNYSQMGSGGFAIQSNSGTTKSITITSTKIGVGDGTDYGTAGQVLTSGGGSGVLSWADSVGTTPTLNAVLTEGNSSDQDILLQQFETEDDYKLSLSYSSGVVNTKYNPTGVVQLQTEVSSNGVFIKEYDVETIGSLLEARPYSLGVRNNNTTTGIDKSIAIDTSTGFSTPSVNLYNYQPEISKTTSLDTERLNITDNTLTSTLTTTYFQLSDADYSTTLGQNGLISTRPALEIQNDTAINIGTTIGVSNYIEIGNLDSTISLVGEVNAPTPATNISSTIVPTTNWVNTFFATITSLGDYLTTATASATYQTIADMANYLTTATASATYQTLAGMSSYLTTATASATYQTIADMANYLTTATASATYQTIADMANYLTTATASATYQTIAGMSSYLTTATASATYQTLAGMSSYLTTATASATYQTIADMTNYLTTATAASTYQTISGLGTALSTVSAITIGTNAGSANTVVIGNNTAPTANYPLVNIKGKFSINDVLFSGGDGGSSQLGVASYTIPQDALRNSLYTLIISGTANPTPLNFPTNDTGGKYITVFNAGSQGVRCDCSASPARLFVGGNNGLAGGATYSIRANQVVQFLSAGSQGFLVFAQTNPNSNQTNFPYPLQTQTTNQRILSTRITGAAVNGTFSYGAFPYNAIPAVVCTAEDATGNHTITLRTSTTTGFTYVSSTGAFPTALSIHIVGT